MIYCKGCGKEHSDRNWLYLNGWYCTKYHKASGKPEFMPEHVKDGQREYFNSIIQPFRQGQLSKEYVDLYGTGGIIADNNEIKKARNVWGDLRGSNTRDKSL